MQGIALLIILGGLCSAVSSIRIGAFNIQNFGKTKLEKTITYGTKTMKTMEVTEVLFKILNRYDVVLIQEIEMNDDKFKLFVEGLNKYGNLNLGYNYVISDYLGTRSDNVGKERYAYIYNTKTINILGLFELDNPDHVNFDRSPFIAHVQDLTPYNALKPFYLVGLHARPCNCIYEMNKLEAVYKGLRISSLPNYDRVIFLGDFNAGCTYFKEGVDERKVPFLYDNDNMLHLINVPTNIAKKCPYDKMVVSKCIHSRDTLSNKKIFDFPSQLFTSGELPMEEAKKVSDHFPIEVELIGNPFSARPTGCVAP